jgi:hypothetical protein
LITPPPSDLDSEALIISPILEGDADALRRIRSTGLTAEHFYADANRRIFETAVALHDRGELVRPEMVARELKRAGQLEAVGGASYVTQLALCTPACAYLEQAAEDVIDAWRKRRVIEIGRRLEAEGANGIADLSAWIRSSATELGGLAARTSAEGSIMGPAAIFAPLEPVAYVIRALDLCPGAPALWAGYGFSGKTLAAQAAALALAGDVGKVWSAFAAPRARVLHLDYEQGSRLTRERYQRLAFAMMLGPHDLGDRLALETMPSIFLDDAGAEDKLERRADGFQLVIIDSLRAAAPTIEENASEARRPLDMLSRISERTGAAFVVIHHARKPNATQQGGAKMAIRGSGALFDACGSVLVFEAEKGEPARVTHEKARASGQLADDFELTVSDVSEDGNPRAGLLVAANAAPSREAQRETTERTKRRAKLDRVRDELVDLFKREPVQGGADGIATKLALSPVDVRGVLRAMVGDGLVQVEGATKDRRHVWAGGDSRSARESN